MKFAYEDTHTARERQRERQRERETERDRDRERQRERQTDRQRERQTDKQIELNMSFCSITLVPSVRFFVLGVEPLISFR